MSQLKSDILIELHIPDFQSAKEFYSSIGYETIWEKPTSENSLGYMVMRNKDSILNFYGNSDNVSQHDFFGRFTPKTPRGYGVEIIIPIDGIENFFELFATRHSKNIVKKLNHEHSHKDFRAVDPFGYYLRFVERYDWVHNRRADGSKID